MSKKICKYMILKRINDRKGIVELESISQAKPKPPKLKQPTLRELVMKVIDRLDGLENRLDNLVKKNNLVE